MEYICTQQVASSIMNNNITPLCPNVRYMISDAYTISNNHVTKRIIKRGSVGFFIEQNVDYKFGFVEGNTRQRVWVFEPRAVSFS